MLPTLMLAAAMGLAQPADTVRLVVVATADLHGYATGWDYLRNQPWPGGLTRVATVVDSLRERYPGQVLVLDAGDALQGSPLAAYFGRDATRDPAPVIDAMNTIGYDVATPGDHDFDFGRDALGRAFAGSTFSWVSANLFALPWDTLALRPYVVLTRNGLRVAVTGFTTPAAMVRNRAVLAGRWRVARIGPSSEPILREARKDADVVIALAHSGLDGWSSYDTTGIGAEHAAARLAAGAARPDLVVAGHAHVEIGDSVLNGVHFVEPRPEGRSLAVVYLSLVPEGQRFRLVRVRAERVPLEQVPVSARVARRLEEPHHVMLGWSTTVLGEADQRLTLAAARVEDTPLLRYLHGLQQRVTGATLSLVPAFDLRAGLERGEITEAEVFALYPEEYTLRAVKVDGATLRAVLERAARYFYVDSAEAVFTNRYVPGAEFTLLGGARWILDLSRPPGERITQLEVGGRPLGDADSVTVALSSYQANGGGTVAALAAAPVVYDKGERIRDLIAADLRRRQVLRAATFAGTDWSLAPEPLAARARALFVRDAAAPAPAAPVDDLVLPATPTRAELARRDSVARERERVDSIARHVEATLRLPADAGADGGLARLVAEAYRNALRADVAVVSGAELTGPLPAGPLTATRILGAVVPQPVLAVELTGEELAGLLEHVVADSGPCCAVAGIGARYDLRRKPFSRVRDVRLANGRAPDRKRRYRVAFSGALVGQDSTFALGGSDCTADGACREPGRLDRWTVTRADQPSPRILLEYLRLLPQPIRPPLESRLQPVR